MSEGFAYSDTGLFLWFMDVKHPQTNGKEPPRSPRLPNFLVPHHLNVPPREPQPNQSWELLARENATNVSIIEGDLREPGSILDHPDTKRLIDFDQPVGLLIVAVWHFISDDERPYELMARYRDQLASGSYVAISHGSLEGVSDEVKEITTAVVQSYGETADPISYRGREQFTAFFEDLPIVDPGIVYCPDWRPVNPVDADDPVWPWLLAAVASKP